MRTHPTLRRNAIVRSAMMWLLTGLTATFCLWCWRRNRRIGKVLARSRGIKTLAAIYETRLQRLRSQLIASSGSLSDAALDQLTKSIETDEKALEALTLLDAKSQTGHSISVADPPSPEANS